MRFLLDTNTCIRYLNGQSESVRYRLETQPPSEIVLCSVVKAELFFGALKSAWPEANLSKVQKFAERFSSLPFDDAAAAVYGEIRANLQRAGTPIGANDYFIGAIALAHGCILVTHNTREFRRIEGLSVEDWEAP